MNISDCLDKEAINLGKHSSTNLVADGIDEIELLQSISKMLYKTKSVRKSIEMIETLANSEYCIRHAVVQDLDEVIFNNSKMSNSEILKLNKDSKKI